MVTFAAMKTWLIVLLFLLISLPAGCSSSGAADDTDDPADAGATTGDDVASEEVNNTPDEGDGPLQKGGAYYQLTITLPSGLQQTFEKQLDEKATSIAFGSAHIAPAVSLTVEDQFYKPFATVTLFFGFVVGSNDHAMTIEEEGKWEWGKGSKNAPPGVKIDTKDQGKPRLMVSSDDEADGAFLITSWGTAGGELVEGKVKGTLVDALAKEKGKTETASIEGEFRLLLPDIKPGN